MYVTQGVCVCAQACAQAVVGWLLSSLCTVQYSTAYLLCVCLHTSLCLAVCVCVCVPTKSAMTAPSEASICIHFPSSPLDCDHCMNKRISGDVVADEMHSFPYEV